MTTQRFVTIFFRFEVDKQERTLEMGNAYFMRDA